MKSIVLTDKTTALAQALIEQKNIFVIETGASPIGEILYTIDRLASAGFDILYLSSASGFQTIVRLCRRIGNIHPAQTFRIIDVESASIGKNNFALRLLRSQDIAETVRMYGASEEKIEDAAYLSALNPLNTAI